MGPPCTGAPPCAIAVVFGWGAPVREVIGASIGGIVTCGDGAPRRLALNAVDDPVWRARYAPARFRGSRGCRSAPSCASASGWCGAMVRLTWRFRMGGPSERCGREDVERGRDLIHEKREARRQ